MMLDLSLCVVTGGSRPWRQVSGRIDACGGGWALNPGDTGDDAPLVLGSRLTH